MPEVHSIMGPNGSGKSTHPVLAQEDYEITEGQILFNGEDLSEMGADERANAGVFPAFQYPVDPGEPDAVPQGRQRQATVRRQENSTRARCSSTGQGPADQRAV